MMKKILEILQDMQRQLNRAKGSIALHFELIAEILKDQSKLEKRLQQLEDKEGRE